MSSPRDSGNNVITASCTLLAPSQMSDGSSPSSPAAITLHTSSQKIVVPVAAVCASADEQSSVQPADGGRVERSSDTVSTTAASLVTSSGQKHIETAAAAASDASCKPASQKSGLTSLVTRRVRCQAKPNISKNARTR